MQLPYKRHFTWTKGEYSNVCKPLAYYARERSGACVVPVALQPVSSLFLFSVICPINSTWGKLCIGSGGTFAQSDPTFLWFAWWPPSYSRQRQVEWTVMNNTEGRKVCVTDKRLKAYNHKPQKLVEQGACRWGSAFIVPNVPLRLARLSIICLITKDFSWLADGKRKVLARDEMQSR